jgi:WD40-like Beta Propeller Repeat
MLAAAPPQAVSPWAPAGISSDQFESHAAFDPRTGDLYFVRSNRDFAGWRILTSLCGSTGWSAPVDPPFAGDGVEADPWFTPDGSTLYFISSRTTDGVRRKDLDIWRVERGANGEWGTPQRLPVPINSQAHEWFPRVSSDGWLYFGSSRGGGLGKTDIWRARSDAAGAWRAENLGAPVNSGADEYEPLPSPDGRSLIVAGEGGLFETRRVGTTWSPRRLLPPEVNVNGTEIGATVSPSGRTLLFSRDTKGPLSGEFFIWRRGGSEDWPPRCPLSERRQAGSDKGSSVNRGAPGR